MKSVQSLFVSIIFSTLVGCVGSSKKDEASENPMITEDYFRHLSYLIQLKNQVASDSLPGFSSIDFHQPIVYYTNERTYVLNPNEHIRRNFDHVQVEPFQKTEVIALSEKYTDTTNFNFTTSYSESDSTAFYFRENVLFFQSFELTKKFLTDINDLQDWSIMVIHELFHGYQRSFPEHKAYYTNLKIPGGPDEFLGGYHGNLDWYSESVFRENELLKEIWIKGADMVQNLNEYDSLRTLRIERIKKEYNVDIREVEDYEIMMEGNARYFESLCKRYLSQHDSDTSMLVEEDKEFLTGMFEGYDVAKDKGLYDIYNDRYYYQLGFNISMILEKHLPDYRNSIYVEEQNFNRYLRELKGEEGT